MSLETKRENAIPKRNEGLQSKTENLTGPKVKDPYYIDDYALGRLTEIHKRARSYYDGMAQSYQELGLGPIDMNVLQKLQDGDLVEFKKQFFDRIEKELDKFNVKIEEVRENWKKGTNIPYDKFETSIELNRKHLERVRGMEPNIELDLNNFSLDNGEVLFTDEDIERMRLKKVAVYLDNAAKQEFVIIAENILNDLTKLKTIMERNGLKYIFGRNQIFEIHDSYGEQKISFNKKIVNQIQH